MRLSQLYFRIAPREWSILRFCLHHAYIQFIPLDLLTHLRLVHVKMIAHVAVQVGFVETINQIVPLLDDLSLDSEPAVKQHLVEQLNLISKFCAKNGEEGYRAIVDQLLPITSRLLEDDKPEVRQAAITTLVETAQHIKADDLGQHVLTIILRLAHEDEKEEWRMTAAELLNSLAEVLGQDLCKQFIIPEVVSLAEDPVFRVRKATALNFHFVCQVGGEHELFERLMPAFVRLSKDDMYRVRRACAESLSDISKYVSDDIRIGVLIEIFLRLTQDPSKLVKQSILQQSGMFIATLPPRAVTDVVLAQFCSMANGPTGDMQVDAELKHYCAYSFPAVLKTIGAGRWKEIREVSGLVAGWLALLAVGLGNSCCVQPRPRPHPHPWSLPPSPRPSNIEYLVFPLASCFNATQHTQHTQHRYTNRSCSAEASKCVRPSRPRCTK